MNVVVGYLRTAEGRAALERGVEEARLRGGRLVVVHSSEGGVGETDEEVEAYREELQSISEDLAARGIDHEIRDVANGHTPASDLLGVAIEEGADLIVIGLRRRRPIGKLLLGSNAQEILLQAECAVLVVKPSSPAR